MNAVKYDGFNKHNFRENIWCSFKTKNNENILIGAIYHSGSSDNNNTNKLYNILKSNNYNSFDRVLICGDFNHPTATWNGMYSNELDEKLYEAARGGYLTQHISKPTRYRVGQKSNILDLVFTRDESDINNVYYCCPLGKSDHILLKIVTSIPKVKQKKI